MSVWHSNFVSAGFVAPIFKSILQDFNLYKYHQFCIYYFAFFKFTQFCSAPKDPSKCLISQNNGFSSIKEKMMVYLGHTISSSPSHHFHHHRSQLFLIWISILFVFIILVGTWNLEFSMEIVLIFYRFKKTRPQELKSLAQVM